LAASTVRKKIHGYGAALLLAFDARLLVKALQMASDLTSSGRLLENKSVLYLHLKSKVCSGLEEWCNVDGKATLVSQKGGNEIKARVVNDGERKCERE
jgi:hypothetical protein